MNKITEAVVLGVRADEILPGARLTTATIRHLILLDADADDHPTIHGGIDLTPRLAVRRTEEAPDGRTRLIFGKRHAPLWIDLPPWWRLRLTTRSLLAHKKGSDR